MTQCTRNKKIITVFFCVLSKQALAIDIPVDMNISNDEKQAIISSMEYAKEISKNAEKINGLPYRRDAHAKATGCLRAIFSIKEDIPPRFQHSIFSDPGRKYEAWIRFSNGDMEVQADSKPDARGMAVKVMGVTGEKIAPEFPGAKTQDFLMSSTPAFFNKNIFDYAEDMKYLAKLERTRWFISFFPPRIHPLQLFRAIQTVSKKIDTPLQPQYYSMLPYKFGDTEIKFSTKPCAGVQFKEKEDKSNPDYLTAAMTETLKSQPACFDFMVQPRVAAENMPLDDATTVWSEKESPFTPIAQIQIPEQEFTSDAQNKFCENLSMNPWHGVGDWQPVGSLNRARRIVYKAVSIYRHRKNNAIQSQPTDWCISDNDCGDIQK